MKNKKIMVITTTDNMIWQFLIPHIKHMQELGNAVECVCARTGFWFDELKDKYGFVMHEIDFTRSPFSVKNLKAYKKLIKLQREQQYNLIYCQQPVGALMGRLIGKKFKVPVIYTAHGFHFYKGCPLKNKLIYGTVEKWLSRYTDVLITINDEDYEAAKKMKAKKAFKINGIGMEFNKYGDTDCNVAETRKLLGLSMNDFVITTVAEFIPRKNYPTMLNAIQILKNKGKEVKFLICGRGKDETKIKTLICKYGIQENVMLLGYRKDVNKILSASNLFMLASFQEGLTLSVIEAMSFGLPCVVSNVRGNRDLIDNALGGFVITPTDANGFAIEIESLINNVEMAKQFGDYNKEKSKEYTIDFVKKQLEEIYEEIE